MATFKFGNTGTDGLYTIQAALGASTSTPLTSKDVGKAVKLGTANNYLLCAADDPIEGILYSVEGGTVNGGYGFGSIQTRKRIRAQVAATFTVTPGLWVVAAAQAAVGTPSLALVKNVALSAAGAFPWRCISIESGTGAAGSIVLLEFAGS